jgi:hypothetical protein
LYLVFVSVVVAFCRLLNMKIGCDFFQRLTRCFVISPPFKCHTNVIMRAMKFSWHQLIFSHLCNDVCFVDDFFFINNINDLFFKFYCKSCPGPQEWSNQRVGRFMNDCVLNFYVMKMVKVHPKYCLKIKFELLILYFNVFCFSSQFSGLGLDQYKRYDPKVSNIINESIYPKKSLWSNLATLWRLSQPI